MFMDYELNVHVNRIVADIVEETYKSLNIPIDMFVVQTDKYENTPYETIVIGLGNSQGMRKDKYYFNAVNNDNDEVMKLYYNEPVSYYENNQSQSIMYRLVVNPMSSVVEVYDVYYIHEGDKAVPQYMKVETHKFGKSKFASKVM